MNIFGEFHDLYELIYMFRHILRFAACKPYLTNRKNGEVILRAAKLGFINVSNLLSK